MKKESLEPKKLALLRIQEILERYSDNDHHLTHNDIIHYLERDYDLILERKAVARDLSLLKEAGVEIESERDGSYLAVRKFDDTEIRILIDGVLSSPFISSRDSKDLIERLCSLCSVYFPAKNKHIYTVNEWAKEENPQLLYNIELISDAIDQKKQLEITFTKYDVDKKRYKRSHSLHVTPVSVFLIEQEYLFLFIWDLNQDDPDADVEPFLWTEPLRGIGEINLLENEDAIPIKSLDYFKNGFSIPKFIKEYGIGKDGGVFTPESGKREYITFACPEAKIRAAIDCFGKNITITKLPELKKNLLNGDSGWDLLWQDTFHKHMVRISAYTTAVTATAFAFENAPFVTILSPESAKERMKEKVAMFASVNKKLLKELGQS